MQAHDLISSTHGDLIMHNMTRTQEDTAVTVVAGCDLTRREARIVLREALAMFRSGSRLSFTQRVAVNAASWAIQFP